MGYVVRTMAQGAKDEQPAEETSVPQDIRAVQTIKHESMFLLSDRYGDIVVDTNRSFEVYREWLRLARPAPGPGNLRRPLWLPRAFRPDPTAYTLGGAPGVE